MEKILQPFKGLYSIIKLSIDQFLEDRAFQSGAALAYFFMFSLPPIFTLLLSSLGRFIGDKRMRHILLDYAQRLSGDTGLEAAKAMLGNLHYLELTGTRTFLTITLIIVSATGGFFQLQSALNTVWGVRLKPGIGFWAFLRHRFISFTIMLVMSGLMFLSLSMDLILSFVHNFLAQFLSIEWQVLAAKSLNLLVSFGLMTTFFLSVFKILPDVRIGWKDVSLGAFFTTVLFFAGRFVVTIYLSFNNMGSAYGAAGSMILLLFWIFLSCQIMLFGAELTEVIAFSRGRAIEPNERAEWIPGYRETHRKQHKALKPFTVSKKTQAL